MITVNDLKNVPVLQGLPDAVFEKLVEIGESAKVKEGEIIYEADDTAENVYIVKNGKVILEVDLNESMTASLASIKPGYIFGWYGMVPSNSHSTRAKAVEETDLLVLPGDSLRMMMDDDHDFGYQFMNKMYLLLMMRLDRRSEQFLQILSRHPALCNAD